MEETFQDGSRIAQACYRGTHASSFQPSFYFAAGGSETVLIILKIHVHDYFVFRFEGTIVYAIYLGNFRNFIHNGWTGRYLLVLIAVRRRGKIKGRVCRWQHLVYKDRDEKRSRDAANF